jgi:DNA polymerase-3 subunit alpha
MERDATGMYFSGQMLDEYSKHLACIKPQEISSLVGEDAEVSEKQRVTVAGVISSVTLKNTKDGGRMAFFTLEDRYGEMECIAFTRVYAQNEHNIRTDLAVTVSGTLSLREDEQPKLLVNRMDALVEDARFNEAALKAETRDSATKTEKSERAPATPEARVQSGTAKPRRLFLRVPSSRDQKAKKARNLAELFEGDFPVFFYDAEAASYSSEPIGIFLTEYVLGEFRSLLGDENVILK